ncbi:MAG TPA: hypothetical protein VKA00_04910 [Trueperaceae bacterium]|nr:hypothetical protein [Trueperaceae bacterium]
MRRIALALAVLAVMFLAACAPSSAPEVKIQQLTKPLSYYPHQTGAHWEYLPDGAKITDPRVTEDVEGPTVVGGQVWIAWHLKGRGLDVTRYRQYRPDGVYLGRENKLGTIITFDPAIQEFPTEKTLRVGATWAGDTTVTVKATSSGDQSQSSSKDQTKTLHVHYVYTVVDKRQVTLAAGTFEVYVVAFTTRTMDANGNIANELTQQLWYTPYVGVIRDENGNVLIASNVLKAPAGGQGGGGQSSTGSSTSSKTP